MESAPPNKDTEAADIAETRPVETQRSSSRRSRVTRICSVEVVWLPTVYSVYQDERCASFLREQAAHARMAALGDRLSVDPSLAVADIFPQPAGESHFGA